MILRTVIFVFLLQLVAGGISASETGPRSQPTNKLELSASERLWISQHPIIRIHMGGNYPPFELRESNFWEGSIWKGLAYDYLMEACNRLGLKVVVTDLSWPEALESIGKQDKGVDLLLTVMHSPERAKVVELTRPYLVFPQVIVTRKDGQFVSGIKDLEGKTIAVEKDYITASWLKRDLPGATIVETPNSVDALRKISSGSAEAYVGNLAVASYIIERNGLTNLKIASPTVYGDEPMSMGVRKDWPELARLFDKSLDSFTPEDHRAIRDRWFSVRYEYGIRPRDVVMWLCVAGAAALAFIVPLRIMVRNKTRELEKHKDLLNAILDNTFQLQGLLTPDGSVLDINKTALNFIETDKEELIGKKFWDTPWWTHSVVEQKRLMEAIIRCAGGESVHYETTIMNSVRNTQYIDFSLKPLRDSSGRINYLIPEGRDISELIMREQALRESEERFQAIFDESPISIVLIEPQGGTYVDVNRKFCELSGVSKDEVLGKTALDLGFIAPQDHQRLQNLLYEKGKLEQEELVATNHSGDRIVSLVDTRFIEIGGHPYLLTMLRDITARKWAEDRLRKSEEDYRNTFENAPVGVFQSIVAGRFTRVNLVFARMLGYESVADALDSITDIVSQIYADPGQRRNVLERTMQEGRLELDEIEFLRKDGSRFSASLYMRAVRDADNAATSFDGFVVDMTERKRILGALREREERIRLYIQRLPVACILWGTDWRVQSWNPAAEFVFGYKEEEALGRTARELIIPPRKAGEQANTIWEYMNQSGMKASSIDENITRDGATILCEWTNTPFFDKNGSITGVISVAQDITMRRHNERALQESENRFRALIEKAPIGISMVRDERYFYSNQAHNSMFGFDKSSEILGTLLIERIAQQCQQETLDYVQKLDRGKTVASQFETIGVRKDGAQFPYLVSTARLNLPDGPVTLSFGTDITERVQARELLVQNEKMTMVAGMAAGMAHEVNNPLGIISQDLQNMERRFSPALPANCAVAEELGLDLSLVELYMERRDIHNYVASMRSAVKRASHIISSMLQFSRQSDATHQLVNLNEIIDQSIRLASNDYDLRKKYDFKHVAITREYDEHLPQTPICITEMEQVFINILKNAAQAMCDDGTSNPSIALRTSHTDGKVVVEISDNGPGISDSVRQRIFDPFFTTKDIGMGTGLGLSVTYTIVTQNHGGELSVESRPGQGACFTIRLPLQRKE
ncbi:MAG: PAS domain S-box protein [Desulfuromonadales bacterium]|nr:PAS domain S-box protein [Desulfuromonadales bacterium]